MKLKDILINMYEDRLKDAIKKEDYETAAKFKKIIDNLKGMKNS